ncbi:hypothetical protein GCM10008027_31100 [Pseudoalteromonas gelatinilytica]|uniref:Uncharacterized protein n=1 Tax=Pseudoalteromonas gelatinilytica TaxID=1703256 RepID=A0ABQ1TU94_9GAMM|nr:hypothetical protein GCM10008027_31100 [Pseudoalteromonas profundi]
MLLKERLFAITTNKRNFIIKYIETKIRPNESNTQLFSVSEINNPQYDNSHNSVI